MKRTSEVTVALAPERWQRRCSGRAGTCRAVPSYARQADRNWWREYVALLEDGYEPFESGREVRRDRDVVRRMQCRQCGNDMELQAFLLGGEVGERLGYRSYAVCPMCRWWAEV